MAEDTGIPENSPQVDAPETENPQGGDQQQAPAPVDPITKLYTAVKDQGWYSKSENEFRQKYNNPENIDHIYSAVSDAGFYSKSKSDFYNQYFPQVKNSHTVSTLNDFVDQSGKLNELKDLNDAASVSRVSIQTPEYEKLASDLTSKISEGDKKLQELGYSPDQVNTLKSDVATLPKVVLNNPSFNVNSLLELKDKNPEQFKRQIGSYQWQGGLAEVLQAKNPKGWQQEYNKIQPLIDHTIQFPNGAVQKGDYNTIRQNNQDIVQMIKNNAPDADTQKKWLDGFSKDAEINYSGEIANSDKALKDDPNATFLNQNQLLAYHHLQDTNPDEAKQYEKILLDPKDLSDEQRLGYQYQKRKLDVSGAVMQMNIADGTIDQLKLKKDLSPSEQATFQNAQINKERFSNYLNDIVIGNNPAYKELSKFDNFSKAQDVLGIQNYSLLHPFAALDESVFNTIKGAENIFAAPFRSPESNAKAQLDVLGNSEENKALGHLTPDNSEMKNYQVVVSPDLQSKIDKIKASDLSDKDKILKTTQLLSEHPGDSYVQPIAPKYNWNHKAIMYAAGDMVAQLAPFFLTEGLGSMVGKAAGLNVASTGFTAANNFLSIGLNSFEGNYEKYLSEGSSTPMKDALITTGIQAAPFAAMDIGGSLKKIFNPESAIGNLISNLSDVELKKIASKGNGLFQGLVDAAKESLQGAVKLTTASTIGEVGTAAYDGQPIDPKEIAERFSYGLAKNALMFGLAGIAKEAVTGDFSKLNDLRKQSLFEAAINPESTMEQIDNAVKAGTLSNEQADAMKANTQKLADILDKTELIDNNGNLLSQKQAIDLFHSKIQEHGINEFLKKDIPPVLREKAEEKLVDLQEEQNQIYAPVEDEPAKNPLAEEDIIPNKQAAGKTEEEVSLPAVNEDGTPTEPQKVLGKSLISEEPEQGKGRSIVTETGLSEEERQKIIDSRIKETSLSDKQIKENELFDMVKKYSNLKNGRLGKDNTEGRELERQIRNLTADLGYQFNKKREKVYKNNSYRKSSELSRNNQADGDKAINKNAVLLTDRDPEIIQAFKDSLDKEEWLQFRDYAGDLMPEKGIKATIQDILDGIPSNRANRYLDEFEKNYRENSFPIFDPSQGEERFTGVSRTREDMTGVQHEEGNEPLTPEETEKYLADESVFTPEEIQENLDNFENLITEYEQQSEEPNRQVQQTSTGSTESDNGENEGNSESETAQRVSPTEERIPSGEGEKPSSTESTGADRSDISGTTGYEPEEPTGETSDAEPVEGPKGSSIKNAFTNAEREARGKERITYDDTTGDKEKNEAAFKRIDNKEINVREVAEVLSRDPNAKVLDKDGNPLKLHEIQNALTYDRIDLNKQYSSVLDILADPKTYEDKGKEAYALERKKILEDALEANHKASYDTGTELSSAFRARQGVFDEFYNRINTIRRYKAATGGKEIPKAMEDHLLKIAKEAEEFQKKLDDITKERDQAQQEKADAEQKLREAHEKLYEQQQKEKKQKEDGQSPKSSNSPKNHKTAERKQQIQKELGDAKALLKKLWNEKPESDGTLTVVPIPYAKEVAEKLAQLAPVLTKLTKLYIEDGLLTVSEILERFRDDFPDELEDVTDRQLRDAITGYGKVRTPSNDPNEKLYRDLKAQMRLTSAIESASSPEEGFTVLKTGYQRDKPSPEVKALQDELDNIMREHAKEAKTNKTENEVYKSKLQAYKTRLQNMIDKADQVIQNKVSLEKYIKDRERKILKLDNGAKDLKTKYQEKKNEIDKRIRKAELANRNPIQKFADFMVNFKREAVVANLTSIPKLAFAGLSTTVRKIPEDIVFGSILNEILPKALMDKAISEGGDLKTQASAVGKGFIKYGQTWVDLARHGLKSEQGRMLKTGKDELDLTHHNTREDELFSLYAGRLHGLLKEPTKQASYVMYMDRMMNNMKGKYDLTDVGIQKMIADNAYIRAKADILTSPNLASQAYRGLVSMLQKGKLGKFGGKLAAGLLKLEMPIVTVPTNFADEILKYNYGSIHAAAKTLEVVFGTALKTAWEGDFKEAKKQIGFKDNLSEAQADYIVRSLKKQMVGAAVYALGFYLNGQIGGYDNKANKKKGLKKGEVKFLGLKIPGYFFHNPVLEPLLMGATLADNLAMHKSIGAGIFEGTAGAIKEVPFIDQETRMIEALKSGESMSKHLADLASGEIPAVFGEVAKWTDPINGTDIYRKPQNFLDAFKMKIPGFREQVKTSLEEMMDKRGKHKTAEERRGNLRENRANEIKIKELCDQVGVKYVRIRHR